MLSDDVTQRLTAYLDGALDARERDQLEQLLRESPEARRLLQRLQTDAQQLRALPRRRPDADLPRRVVAAAAARGLRPAAPRPWRWLSAAAASLLLVATASYFLRQAGNRLVGVPQAANAPERQQPRLAMKQAPALGDKERVRNAPTFDTRTGQAGAQPAAPSARLESAKDRSPAPPLHAAPAHPPAEAAASPSSLQDVRLGTIERQMAQAQTGSAMRIEVVAADPARLFTDLQAAVRSRGLALQTAAERDQPQQASRQEGQLLYTEGLSGQDIAAILAGLQASGNASTKGGAVPSRPTIRITSLGSALRDELTAAANAASPARAAGARGGASDAQAKPTMRGMFQTEPADQRPPQRASQQQGPSAPPARRAVVLSPSSAPVQGAPALAPSETERPGAKTQTPGMIPVLWVICPAAPASDALPGK